MDKICITLQEAADLASVSYDQMQAWSEEYDFPSMKIGAKKGKSLVHLESLNEWLRNKCQMRVGVR